ncbi:hypothetical protein [Pelobium manganitolerans]|uniref:hypothetical protein n=1 Tax=Pelobium manganitolerans TaxID=1842495 RepID=UPI003FA35B17
MTEYRKHLIDSASNFIRFMYELSANIAHLLVDIGIGMEDTFFENGEVTLYEVKDFANVNDKNIQELIKLYGLVSEAHEVFTAINDIWAFDSTGLSHEGVFDERLGLLERWGLTGELMFSMETVVPRGGPCPEFDNEIFASTYRQYLVKAVVTLGWYGQEVYSNIFNLVMEGSFSEASERFKEGKALYRNMTDFEGVEDPNVKELIKISNTVIDYHNLLCKINNIQNEELMFFVCDMEGDE